MVRQRAPSTAGFEHAGQHADIHVDGAIRSALIVARALVVGDHFRRDSGERHVSKVPLQRDEPLLLELDGARRAVQALAVDVGVDRLEQPLRPLGMRGNGSESGIFDQLPLLLPRRLQVGRAQTFAIATLSRATGALRQLSLICRTSAPLGESTLMGCTTTFAVYPFVPTAAMVIRRNAGSEPRSILPIHSPERDSVCAAPARLGVPQTVAVIATATDAMRIH
jgi:hypothetical protein